MCRAAGSTRSSTAPRATAASGRRWRSAGRRGSSSCCSPTRISRARAARRVLAGSALVLAAVVVANGYVRDTLPGQTVTAAYCDLVNAGPEDAVLVAVSTPIAASVEIHETRDEAGMVRMRRLERIVVPAGSSVRLEPGGRHLMLFDADTKGIQEARFVFEFAAGQSIRGAFEIRAP
ncbi:MAG: copper chaperone PCu(A)C [Gammaproteobacteria bacterium]|nr:copper chaperone PCu(A)C [Gammaproteobacteria bacterium]